MKALILAGGAGTRLRPITHTSAKQLVPVANKPILFYGIEAMVAAGITEIGVIVGDTRAEVMAALGDGIAVRGASITYIPQDAPLGLAHCVLIARGLPRRRRLRDVPRRQPARAGPRRVRATRSRRRGTDRRRRRPRRSCSKQVPDPHRFGIAELDADGHVVRLVEKPADPPSRPRARRRVPVRHDDPRRRRVRSSRRRAASSRSPTRSSGSIDQGYRVRSELLTGWWIDTGKLTPLLEANRLLLEKIETRRRRRGRRRARRIDGRVVVEAGAEIVELDHPRPGRRSAPDARIERQLHRPVQRRSATAARSATARSSTRS